MRAKRVVLDTNTIVMPITRTTSNDSWIVREWQRGTVCPLISEATELELLESLRKPKFGLDEEEIVSTAAIYLDHCTMIEIPEDPPETPQCDDPSDRKFLILAYQAKETRW